MEVGVRSAGCRVPVDPFRGLWRCLSNALGELPKNTGLALRGGSATARIPARPSELGSCVYELVVYCRQRVRGELGTSAMAADSLQSNIRLRS